MYLSIIPGVDGMTPRLANRVRDRASLARALVDGVEVASLVRAPADGEEVASLARAPADGEVRVDPASLARAPTALAAMIGLPEILGLVMIGPAAVAPANPARDLTAVASPARALMAVASPVRAPTPREAMMSGLEEMPGLVMMRPGLAARMPIGSVMSPRLEMIGPDQREDRANLGRAAPAALVSLGREVSVSGDHGKP